MTEDAIKINNTTWRLTVMEDETTKQLYIELPEDVLKQMGWQENDVVEWINKNASTWTLEKKKKE